MHKEIFLLLLKSYLVDEYVELSNVLVKTTVGEIYGIKSEDFTMFLGVPYGVIDERDPFGPATPHPPFITPYQAYDDSVICLQYFKGEIKGTIQCLQLNIYIPNTRNRNRAWAVMVYIHGGGFEEGDGSLSTYSPKFLVRHDVVFVTIQYRLGPYGYLCFPRSQYSNQGLKDQSLALRWIKENIKSFGGDVNNILLFGHSAGSVTVDFHLLYNNDNLFHKVILQSGNAVHPHYSVGTDMKLMAQKVGFQGETIDVNEFIRKLSTIDTYRFINMTKYQIYRPCIDDLFLAKTPKTSNLQNIKIMTGITSKEMLFLYGVEFRNFLRNFKFVSELEKGFKKLPASATDIVSKFYSHFDNFNYNIIDFNSDYAYNYPNQRSVNYYLRNNATVYKYLFSYDGGRNFLKHRDNITEAGSTHGDELGYVFDMPLFGSVAEADQLIVDRVSYLWTNFAKYGNPTPTRTSLVPMEWSPLSASTQPYLQIDTIMKLHGSGPLHKRMAFWALFYERYGMYDKGISLGEEWPTCERHINKY